MRVVPILAAVGSQVAVGGAWLVPGASERAAGQVVRISSASAMAGSSDRLVIRNAAPPRRQAYQVGGVEEQVRYGVDEVGGQRHLGQAPARRGTAAQPSTTAMARLRPPMSLIRCWLKDRWPRPWGRGSLIPPGNNLCQSTGSLAESAYEAGTGTRLRSGSLWWRKRCDARSPRGSPASRLFFTAPAGGVSLDG